MEQKKNPNKKHKFTIVDLVVLLVLVAGIAFVGYRMLGDAPAVDESGEYPEKTYMLTFASYETRDVVADQLEEGALVTNETGTIEYGTADSFTFGPSQVYGTNADGESVLSEKEGFCSVEVKVQVTAEDRGYGVAVNGKDLLGVGNSSVVRVGNVKLWVVLIGIEEIADAPQE